MEKITLTKVARYTKKKDGSPLVSSSGKPYTSVRVQCREHGEQWISGFGNQDNSSWKEGDTVEVIIEKKGDYLNFSMPKSARSGGGLSSQHEAMLISASRESYSANANIIALTRRLEEAGVIKPFAPKMEYPEEEFESPF